MVPQSISTMERVARTAGKDETEDEIGKEADLVHRCHDLRPAHEREWDARVATTDPGSTNKPSG